MNDFRTQELTFRHLLRDPQIQRLAEDARSIGKNATGDWYPQWIGKYIVFLDLTQRIADDIGLPVGVVRTIAKAGLLDEYHSARQRNRRPTVARTAVKTSIESSGSRWTQRKRA